MQSIYILIQFEFSYQKVIYYYDLEYIISEKLYENGFSGSDKDAQMDIGHA